MHRLTDPGGKTLCMSHCPDSNPTILLKNLSFLRV